MKKIIIPTVIVGMILFTGYYLFNIYHPVPGPGEADEPAAYTISSDLLIISESVIPTGARNRAEVKKCVIFDNKEENGAYLNSCTLKNYHVSCCLRDAKYSVTAVNDSEIVYQLPFELPKRKLGVKKYGIYYDESFERKTEEYINSLLNADRFYYLYSFWVNASEYDEIQKGLETDSRVAYTARTEFQREPFVTLIYEDSYSNFPAQKRESFDALWGIGSFAPDVVFEPTVNRLKELGVDMETAGIYGGKSNRKDTFIRFFKANIPENLSAGHLEEIKGLWPGNAEYSLIPLRELVVITDAKMSETEYNGFINKHRLIPDSEY